MTTIRLELKKANFHVQEAIHIIHASLGLESFYNNLMEYLTISNESNYSEYFLFPASFRKFPIFPKNLKRNENGKYILPNFIIQESKIIDSNQYHLIRNDKYFGRIISFNDTHGIFPQEGCSLLSSKLIAFSDIPIKEEIKTGF